MTVSVEICAGAGGQALGLEMGGFEHAALVELESTACATLRLNRPGWKVIETDLRTFSGVPYQGVELLAGGVPCPPFSIAGKKLGGQDERDLFPAAIRLVDEIRPQAVMLENVRGLLAPAFLDYRQGVSSELDALGYAVEWRLLNASDFGVSQLRPRVICVAVRKSLSRFFTWPQPHAELPMPVGELLYDLMASRGWDGASRWRELASGIAPTLVGGSKKHGGPDLGPTRARLAWAALGVDGLGISDMPPAPDFVGLPKLTVRMAARVQGFPDDWQFFGKKTAAYRQVGNAFPPPVAAAVARQIRVCLEAAASRKLKKVA
ncbi:MAG: DNA cytosine methyltransferase [Burkholderiales bacterium]|jgi:DNA (cytosine-5)-methyltransferase 1